MEWMKQKETAGGGANRKYSLKWGVIAIVALCWILPVLTVGGATIYYISRNIDEQTALTLTDSVAANVSISVDRLNSAVAASRQASYDPTIKEAQRSYIRTGNYPDMYTKIKAFLDLQYRSDERFSLTIFLLGGDMQEYSVTAAGAPRETVGDFWKYDRDAVIETARKLDTRIGFVNSGGRLYMVRNVVDPGFTPIGALAMRLDEDYFFGSLANVPWGTDVTLYLRDTPFVLRGDRLEPHGLRLSLRAHADYQKTPQGSFLCGRAAGDAYGLSYIVGVDLSSLLGQLSGFKYVLVGMAVFFIPCLALVLLFSYRDVTRPIAALVAAARRIESGALGCQVEGRADSREFQYLFDSFNEMSGQLKDLFQKVYYEEIALRDARIMALQSQINPHFLNNTLEIINWEARMGDSVKVCAMIEALSTMLDAAMDRSRRPTIHLSEELMYVDAYLHIISERLGKRLQVEKQIAQDTLDLYVPRLILQPIIENAVEHGIEPRQKGTVRLRSFRGKDTLVLEVENDGKMTAEDEERVKKLLSDDYDASGEGSHNLGIRNVHQRLRILYGEESGLSIRRTAREGSIARMVIRLPDPSAPAADPPCCMF